MTDNQDEEKYILPAEYATEVYRTETDLIAIRQEDTLGNDDSVVIISPERVDRLIQLLKNVKEQILTDRADAAEARARREPPFPTT